MKFIYGDIYEAYLWWFIYVQEMNFMTQVRKIINGIIIIINQELFMGLSQK